MKFHAPMGLGFLQQQSPLPWRSLQGDIHPPSTPPPFSSVWQFLDFKPFAFFLFRPCVIYMDAPEGRNEELFKCSVRAAKTFAPLKWGDLSMFIQRSSGTAANTSVYCAAIRGREKIPTRQSGDARCLPALHNQAVSPLLAARNRKCNIRSIPWFPLQCRDAFFPLPHVKAVRLELCN